MDASTEMLLQTRRHERAMLLQRATEMLRADGRIGAAWLFGSIGRGSSDALSDLDLWTVVADDAIDALVAARRAYVAQLGAPLLVLESPRNAPAGGGYLLVLYPGAVGPQQVDWYWQPRRNALFPGDGRLVFDRVGLARDPSSSTLDLVAKDGAAVLETPLQRATFFWAMSPIAAKKIARRDASAVQSMLSMLAWALGDVRRWTHAASPESEAETAARSGVVPSAPSEQMAQLRAFVGAMEAMHPAIAGLDAALALEAVPQIARFIDLAAAILDSTAD